jgi:hypothetical protein
MRLKAFQAIRMTGSPFALSSAINTGTNENSPRRTLAVRSRKQPLAELICPALSRMQAMVAAAFSGPITYGGSAIRAALKWLKGLVADLYQAVSVWGLMLLALLVFEEGVPFLGVYGRVANHAAAEVESAKAGLVAQASLDAVNAKLAAMELRAKQAELLVEQARAVGETITQNEGRGDAALKDSIAADHRADGARWSASDIDWLCNERKRLGLSGACSGGQGGR